MGNTARAAFAAVFALAAAAYGDVALDFSSAGPLPADAGRGVLRRAAMAVGASVTDPSAVGVGETVELKLFDGVAFSLSVVAAPPAGIAGRSFIARDAAGTASAIVKTGKGGLRVFIDDFGNGRSYIVRAKNGLAEAVERDRTQTGDECCGTCSGGLGDAPATEPAAVPAAGRKAFAAAPDRGSGFDLAEQKAVIDILVAFDQGAKAWARDTWANAVWKDEGTMEEFAGYAVDKMNMVLEKSQLLDRFCYRLVGVAEVDATWDVINNNLLNTLRTRSGSLAKLAALREKCGADTITLLVDRNRSKSTTAGLGYEWTTQWNAAGFDANGYTCNVCDIKTVDERYTMSHETGHNMGCGHSNRQGDDSGPGRYSYSCGYHFPDANNTLRYTIMAYDSTSPASGTYLPVPYFSSPDITPAELGVPVGTVESNDNRRTLLQTYEDVSGWREHKIPYDWDVRFVDDEGNDIDDNTYFTGTLYVTLTNTVPGATIYYTYDGTTPGPGSYTCRNGQRFTIYDTRSITACAVVGNVAQSVRTAMFTYAEGLRFGEEEENRAWAYGTAAAGAETVTCTDVSCANSMVWTDTAWSGTLVFQGLSADDSTKNFQPERYGNAGSKMVFRNCEIFYFINNNATFPGTLVLDGDGALRFGGNGYSNNWNAFGELAGDGSISASSNHKQAYVFNTATNYTGSISIGAANYASAKQGRRVVFGSVSAAADLPAQSATVTLQSGAAAAIGGSATWSAYHGVDLSGTLAVKGANATLDCDASAATGLRLNDGATLRFDAADAKLTLAKAPAFASGTVRIVFGPGVSPVSGRILVAWPSGSVPDGNFAFADSALAAQWDLCKTSGGLAAKPKDRFDVPGTELLCFTEAQVSDWLDDNNFWIYEENNPGATWRDFMAETGENGYVNWMNYALGFGAESASEKLVATVSVNGAAVTVSVAGSLANAPAIPGGRLLCTLYSADEVGDWDGGTAMEGRTAVLQAGSAPRGFYFVAVTLVESP